VAVNEESWAVAWEKGIDPRWDPGVTSSRPFSDTLALWYRQWRLASIRQEFGRRTKSTLKNGSILRRVADLMVTEGSLIRQWSEEKQQFAYRATDILPVSQLAV